LSTWYRSYLTPFWPKAFRTNVHLKASLPSYNFICVFWTKILDFKVL
jgi:hypothetical protein